MIFITGICVIVSVVSLISTINLRKELEEEANRVFDLRMENSKLHGVLKIQAIELTDKKEEVIGYVKEILYTLHKEGKEGVAIDYEPNEKLKAYDVQIEDDIRRCAKIIKLAPKFKVMK
jgi:regulator of replication initiation timing